MAIQHSVLTWEEVNKWELQLSDAGRSPDSEDGLRLNSIRVWARYDGGPWKCTSFRSMQAAFRHLNTYGSLP